MAYILKNLINVSATVAYYLFYFIFADTKRHNLIKMGDFTANNKNKRHACTLH